MRRHARGVLAFVMTLVLGAGVAHAEEQRKSKTASREQAARSGGEKEISGRVLQASPSRLFIEHMGAVVELSLAPDAKFSGGNVTSSRDISEGQEVRASFTVENNTTNMAKQITVTSAGTGAAPAGGTGTAREKTGMEGGTTGAAPGERPAPQEREPGMPTGATQRPSTTEPKK
jgi:hypothetical protein